MRRDKNIVVRLTADEEDYLRSLAEMTSPEFSLSDIVRIGSLSLAHRLAAKPSGDLASTPSSSPTAIMAAEIILIEKLRQAEKESAVEAIEEPT